MDNQASNKSLVPGKGGVAAKLTQKAMEIVHGWTSAYLADHGEEVEYRARKNAAAFVTDLNTRVETLDRQYQARGDRQTLLQHLSEPDFHATLHAALVASARTESEEKHLLLSRAVAERLGAEADSLTALASVQAVDVIPRLTARQLGLLGVAALIFGIRPPFLLEGVKNLRISRAASREEKERHSVQYRALGKAYADWLDSTLEAHGDEWTRTTHADVAHLVSSACIVYDPNPEADLSRVLERMTVSTIADSLRAPPGWGPTRRFYTGWQAILRHVTLTPAGFLIGVAVHDAKVGDHTPIDLADSPFATPSRPHKSSWAERDKFSKMLDSELRRRGM